MRHELEDITMGLAKYLGEASWQYVKDNRDQLVKHKIDIIDLSLSGFMTALTNILVNAANAREGVEKDLILKFVDDMVQYISLRDMVSKSFIYRN